MRQEKKTLEEADEKAKEGERVQGFYRFEMGADELNSVPFFLSTPCKDAQAN